MPRSTKADAIVVLGCPPSRHLERRVEHMVYLFRQGFAPVLVLSGGGSGGGPEAEIMRPAALACGVPEAALLVETRSRDTLSNARETGALLHARGWRPIMLVSDGVHLPHVALLFRLADIVVVGCSGVRSASAATAIR